MRLSEAVSQVLAANDRGVTLPLRDIVRQVEALTGLPDDGAVAAFLAHQIRQNLLRGDFGPHGGLIAVRKVN